MGLVAHSLQSVDWTTIGTNVGVFCAAASALFMGIKTGLKKISRGEIAPTTDKSKVAGAMLVETTSMLMWSESNRDVVEAVNRLCDFIQDNTREQTELRHQIERLRDKM